MFLIFQLIFLIFINISYAATEIKDEGVHQGYANILDCVGAGINCTFSNITGTLTVGGGGGSGDVTDVGDCTSGACLDGTSDGGTKLELYQTGSSPTDVYFTDSSASNKTYFDFDGTTLLLYVAGTLQQEWTSSGAAVATDLHPGTRCLIVPDTAAADDNYPMASFVNQATIKSVWCTCSGTCTTKATFTLENGSGTGMTITGTNPTCSNMGTIPTAAAVTANNVLSARDSLRFDVTNTPSPETDTYEICTSYTE